MRNYQCTCGNVIFFDNCQCVVCSSELGFCPSCRLLVGLVPAEQGEFRCGNPSCGQRLQKCFNYSQHNVCNRCVVAPPTDDGLCDCCRFNDTIPDLSQPGNWEKWRRLEAAKRRLFYDLSELGLPYGMEVDGIDPPLRFDFKADVIPGNDRWRPVGTKQRIFTGHAAGRITINIREADDAEREKMRVEFGEAHRTLIGHFRHEVGHYYWDQLVKGRREEQCIEVFGDHNCPSYSEAMEKYYQAGPAADWQARYVSPYASMHPWEDFAETWATYLDMVSGLDTSHYVGFGGVTEPTAADIDNMILRYQSLGIALNEINRSMGLLDVVPEVFVEPVVNKLRFIHSLALAGRSENQAIQETADVSPPLNHN